MALSEVDSFPAHCGDFHTSPISSSQTVTPLAVSRERILQKQEVKTYTPMVRSCEVPQKSVPYMGWETKTINSFHEAGSTKHLDPQTSEEPSSIQIKFWLRPHEAMASYHLPIIANLYMWSVLYLFQINVHVLYPKKNESSARALLREPPSGLDLRIAGQACNPAQGMVFC